LTVKGTGFASTAVINWNGSPILTSVESGSRLTSRISAAKVRKAGTDSITVTNPAPGGGTSNVDYLPIQQLFSTVAMANSTSPPPYAYNGTALTVGDFNNDGKLDIVSAQSFTNGIFGVFLGNGDGTVVTLSPLGVNFGDQKVGTSSAPVPVELSNKRGTTLSITQITISGKNSGDFTQKNNCGQSVRAHGDCTISVTFTPTATGQRPGAVSVTDNGGGSPQSVPLAGTGT
jgi:hypothetical protein